MGAGKVHVFFEVPGFQRKQQEVELCTPREPCLLEGHPLTSQGLVLSPSFVSIIFSPSPPLASFIILDCLSFPFACTVVLL